MKIARSTLLLALALALLTAAGCGNKGDLVRPQPKTDGHSGA